jgi:hypothetical protein
MFTESDRMRNESKSFSAAGACLLARRDGEEVEEATSRGLAADDFFREEINFT